MARLKSYRSFALQVVALAGINVFCCDTGPTGIQKAQSQPHGAPPERTYPSLPGAVRECPGWLKKNAPFDAVEWFRVVAPDENAAPLYLDALYEFCPQDLEKCIDPTEVEARGASIRSRVAQTGAGLTAKHPALSSEHIAEYVPAFEKLKEAQQRKRCVFETGLGFDAVLPHAQASRAVVRVLDWRVEFDVVNGRIDEAIGDIGLGLRLSRDLRPRGYLISQLVSVALDSVIMQSLVPKVLGSKDLTVAHCDRLQRMLEQHVNEGADLLSEGCRAEYVSLREILHRFETGEDPVEALMLDEQVNEILRGFGAVEFAAEIDALNRFFRPLVERRKRPPRDFAQIQPDLQRAAGDLKALKNLLPSLSQFVDAICRDLTRTSGTRCLVAVRRWQLGHSRQSPPDLLAACKDAGIGAVPIDDYSVTGEALRFAQFDGEFVVYSVARDGKDDGGEFDWNFTSTGDWILRLPPLP